MDKTVSLFGVPRRYCYGLLDLIDEDIVVYSKMGMYKAVHELLDVHQMIEAAIQSTYKSD